MENIQVEQGQGDHDHKTFSIIVNARPKEWGEKVISYKEVVELAYDTSPDNPDITYTITYSKGPESNREGSLVKGKSVKVKDGMIFNVTRTDKS